MNDEAHEDADLSNFKGRLHQSVLATWFARVLGTALLTGAAVGLVVGGALSLVVDDSAYAVATAAIAGLMGTGWRLSGAVAPTPVNGDE